MLVNKDVILIHLYGRRCVLPFDIFYPFPKISVISERWPEGIDWSIVTDFAKLKNFARTGGAVQFCVCSMEGGVYGSLCQPMGFL